MVDYLKRYDLLSLNINYKNYKKKRTKINPLCQSDLFFFQCIDTSIFKAMQIADENRKVIFITQTLLTFLAYRPLPYQKNVRYDTVR